MANKDDSYVMSPQEWLNNVEQHSFDLLGVGSFYELIFNHDFAKALWGGGVYANFYAGKHGDTIDFKGLNWQGHLINMVIADDPIKYLGENI